MGHRAIGSPCSPITPAITPLRIPVSSPLLEELPPGLSGKFAVGKNERRGSFIIQADRERLWADRAGPEARVEKFAGGERRKSREKLLR